MNIYQKDEKTLKFIERVKLIPHKTICSYRKTVFINWKTKVIITCEDCGNDFNQLPYSHLNGHSCPYCDGKYKSTEDFIKEAKLVKHSTEIGYDKTIYINAKTKSIFICLKCNNDFLQLPNSHLRGNGCPICSGRIKTTEDFIKEAKLIPHKTKIGYDKFVYNGAFTKSIFTCLDCGNDFECSPDNHLHKKGCPKCAGKNKTTEEFIKEAKLIMHTTEIGYDKFIYVNSYTKGIFTCLNCEQDFNQTPNAHLRGVGCPRCRESKGERSIRRYLNENNTLYDDQYSFDDCKNIKTLPFDFVLLDENKNCKALIEYQGLQHFKLVKIWGGIEKLKYTQQNDKIKLDYTIQNNIPLLRISYKEYKNIPTILENFIKSL